jgi:hypothetical protein
MIVFKAAFGSRVGTKLRASKLKIMTPVNSSILSCGWFKIRTNRRKVQMKIARFPTDVTSRKGMRNQES